MTNVEAIFSKQSVETFLRFFFLFWGEGGGGQFPQPPLLCTALLSLVKLQLVCNSSCL